MGEAARPIPSRRRLLGERAAAARPRGNDVRGDAAADNRRAYNSQVEGRHNARVPAWFDALLLNTRRNGARDAGGGRTRANDALRLQGGLRAGARGRVPQDEQDHAHAALEARPAARR